LNVTPWQNIAEVDKALAAVRADLRHIGALYKAAKVRLEHLEAIRKQLNPKAS